MIAQFEQYYLLIRFDRVNESFHVSLEIKMALEIKWNKVEKKISEKVNFE